MRRATRADTDALAYFHSEVVLDPTVGQPEPDVGVWTRELMSGAHPTCAAGDFTIVEDTRSGAIVSSLSLISQTWSYGGIPFGVGRPELVGTDPDYRRRGLVRAQFAIVHAWSAERGQRAQAITGIPWYYRQFGYERALPLGGGRIAYVPHHVPALNAGETERVRVRIGIKLREGGQGEANQRN